MDFVSEEMSGARKKHKKKQHSTSFRPETFTASVSDTIQDDITTTGDSVFIDEPQKRKKKSRQEAKSDRVAADEEDRDDAQFASQLIDAALPAELLVEAGEDEEPVKKKRKERRKVTEAATEMSPGTEENTSENKKTKKKQTKTSLEEEVESGESLGKDVGETKTEGSENEEKNSSRRSKKKEAKRLAAGIPLGNFETGVVEESSEEPKSLLKKKGDESSKKTQPIDKKSNVKPKKPIPKPSPSGNPTGNPHVDPAILYLRTWKSSRSAWTFQKVRQVWLLRNWRDRAKMQEDDFSIFLEYIVELRGGSRKKTVEEAKNVKEEFETNEIFGVDAELKQKLHQRAVNILDVLATDVSTELN